MGIPLGGTSLGHGCVLAKARMMENSWGVFFLPTEGHLVWPIWLLGKEREAVCFCKNTGAEDLVGVALLPCFYQNESESLAWQPFLTQMHSLYSLAAKQRYIAFVT
ncbi:unnamed protein product [Ixodes persulcatus]